MLASSLDYEDTLARVAELAVPRLARLVRDRHEGRRRLDRRLAVAHVDPEKVHWAQELGRSCAPRADDDEGIARVLAHRAARVRPGGHRPDAGALAQARRASARRCASSGSSRTWWCRSSSRGRALGAITFASATPADAATTQRDLALAEELARRAAVAIDNARLFRQAEERGQAARVLASVGDGVVLLDRPASSGYWNPAAEAITGLARADVVGRPADEAIPGWSAVGARVPVADEPRAVAARPRRCRSSSAAASSGSRSRASASTDGTVFAFRDVTEERALEQLQGASSSRRCRTSCARRSRRSTAPR